jgi:hypothetical protein
MRKLKHGRPPPRAARASSRVPGGGRLGAGAAGGRAIGGRAVALGAGRRRWGLGTVALGARGWGTAASLGARGWLAAALGLGASGTGAGGACGSRELEVEEEKGK